MTNGQRPPRLGVPVGVPVGVQLPLGQEPSWARVRSWALVGVPVGVAVQVPFGVGAVVAEPARVRVRT